MNIIKPKGFAARSKPNVICEACRKDVKKQIDEENNDKYFGVFVLGLVCGIILCKALMFF